VNPVMAAVVYRSAAGFAALKMMMTGISVTMMVMLARYRFMRMVRVDVVMYLVFAGYVALLVYECRLRSRSCPVRILRLGTASHSILRHIGLN